MTNLSMQLLAPIIASLGAALVAGIASYIAGRGMRSHEWKLGLVRERLLERQRLYAKFVAEADRNMLLVAGAGAKSIDNVMPLLGKRRRNPALLGGAIYPNGRAEGGLASGL